MFNGPFSSEKRIRTFIDYQKVFHQGSRLYSLYYVLYYRSNKLGYSRLGVITSKRNTKGAVQRNLIKRMAKETFRLKQWGLRGNDFVLVARKQAVNTKKRELRRCLEKLFAKLT